MRLLRPNVSYFVNIRATASSVSDVVGKLFSAGVVKIEEVDGDWAKITSNEVSGYIKTEYLYTGDKAISLAEKTYTKYAKVTCNSLNIRTGPGEDYDILAKAAIDEKFQIIDIMDEWVKIELNSSSEEAYVSKNYVDFIYDFKYAKSLDEVKTDINCMVWPLPSDHSICTYYGYRVAPTRGASTFHQGLDIGGAKGSKIVAVLSGKVIETGYSSSGGYFVEIDHGKGVISRYLHNSKILVSTGQYVDQGEVISLVGSTGISTAPHLHFSLVLNGKNVDPYPYLKRVH
jgi:murein DD-endopeptidase MepM/ murein hydrolase activator NlpD